MKSELTKIALYGRYIIFEWSEYDNAAPFSCVISSHEDTEEAIKKAIAVKKEYDDFVAIFDRVAGELFMVEVTK